MVEQEQKNQMVVKSVLVAGVLIAVAMIAWGMRGDVADAQVAETQSSAGIGQYTEELVVDWIELPGEEPIVIRHDDGSTWTVLPFGPGENVE